MSELATLRTAKQALEEGLITAEDFESIKQGFLNAQRIKAGLDAGFIPEEDFTAASNAFFESLGVHNSRPKSTTTQKKPVQSAQGARNGSPFSRPVANSSEPAPAGMKPRAAPSPTPGLAQRVHSLTQPAKPVVASTKVSMAGISVDENAVAEFMVMKSKSQYLWMMFKIDDTGKSVILSEHAGHDSNFADFVACFPDNECRYAVYDYAYETSERRLLQKLVFINWAPDNAPVKSKMMFASTKDFFKNCLGGVQVEMQINDIDDLTDDEVAASVGHTLTRA